MSLLYSTSPMLGGVIGCFLPHADKSAWGSSYYDISDVAGEESAVSVFHLVLVGVLGNPVRCRLLFGYYFWGVGSGLSREVSVPIFHYGEAVARS